MESETQPPVTVFDSLIQDRQLQMMKAALPYIGSSNLQSMAFFIKFMELEHTVALFHNPQNTLKICSLPEADEPRPLQLLDAIKEFCSEKEQENIDMLLNYMQIFSAYGTLFT